MELARTDRPRKKVGLALGSGVARGLAHIGVLQVFEREGIPVDIVAGTSIGSVIGGLFALGKNSEEILQIARRVGSHPFNYLVDLSIPKTGLIKGKKIEGWLKEFFGDAEFSDCIRPFRCVATDIDNGEEVVFSEGPLWEAIRASISIPIIFSAVEREKRFLVDGAIVNPVPVSLLRDMGAESIIAVNVIPDRDISDKTQPNIFDIIMQTLRIVEYSMVKSSAWGADILLEPEVDRFALTDFQHVDECVEMGAAAANDALPAIKKLLAE